jgi:hypothetical protein
MQQLLPRLILILSLAVLLASASCMKKESYPDTPEIRFEQFLTVFGSGQYATTGILTISFTDGDGNIGLFPWDTMPPYNPGGEYYYNYVIEYFEKQNGRFVKVDLDPPYSARIPYLLPQEQHKAIKGVITDTLQLNPAPVFDTIRFRFFIYDRTPNRSNVDSTPPIILRRP